MQPHRYSSTSIPTVTIGEVKLFMKKLNTAKAVHSKDYPVWITKSRRVQLSESGCTRESEESDEEG